MNLTWHSLNRQKLPDVLTNKSKLPIGGVNHPQLVDSDILLGVYDVPKNGAPVVALALVGSSRKELFSWISTYAEELFPLSQFCRICAIEDWNQLELQTLVTPKVGTISPIWSSIVLGEMLGQADADTDVSGVPLARANACYSFAIARTSYLYPDSAVAQNLCIDRLNMVERDSRFGRRQITVESLKKTWSIALALQDIDHESANFLETVLKIAAAIDNQIANILASNHLLLSDSAEDRVGGFDAVSDVLSKKLDSNSISREAGAAAFAAAALLAGRGTSHIQLLAPCAKRFPETLVWYGLLAGMLGPQGWDKAWAQQTKGVERYLRQFFRPDEPVIADICWPEYEWITKTFDSLEVLSSIPKNTPRSLAVELLPGVSCQFRFGAPAINAKGNIEERHSADTVAINKPHAVTNDKLVLALDLLTQVQKILQSNPSARETVQPSLFDKDSPIESGKPTRPKSRGKITKNSTNR